MRFDPATFTLNAGDGDQQESIFLGNVYSTYCRVPRGDRKDVLDSFVASRLERITEVPASLDEARTLLMPAARSRAFFSCSELRARLHGMGDGFAPPALELPCGVAIGLVLDYPHTMRYVLNDTLRTWGVSLEEAMEVAKENLRRKSRERIEKVHECLYVLPWQDSYDAARLMLPELFTRLDVAGDPVALAVHRDLVLVTGSEDVAGLALMAATAEDEMEKPYPVSVRPLVLRDFEWSEFVVQKLSAPYKRLALAEMARDYADQRELLSELTKRDDKDIFIANFYAVEHTDTKALSSWVTWSASGVQLLPQSETISFVDVDRDGESKSVATVAWERASSVVGARMKMQDLYPPMWKVESFPTDVEFRAMTTEEGAPDPVD
jgi:hypothetical protein